MAEESEEVVEVEDTSITVFDEAEPEVEAEAETTEEAKGEEEAEEVTEVTETEETTSEPPSQPQHVPIAALTAERRKRQEAAAKLEHYEEIPDPVESPKEYAEFVRNEAQANSLNERINLSRSIMVDMDPDYSKYEAEFMASVSEPLMGEDGKQVIENGIPQVKIVNQDLFNQFRDSPNPAKFARDMGKDIQMYRERMDPAFEQKLRQQWEAEKATMPDLTTATASGNNSEPVETPTELSNVFDGSPL
jgi:hypothetical protein